MSAFIRSLMFVPGHRQRMVDRALGLGEFTPAPIDVAMLDMEDGVPLPEKDHARNVIADSLGRASNSSSGPLRYVRINSLKSDRLTSDLAAAMRRGLDGIVAPKVDAPEDLATLANLLEAMEPKVSVAKGQTRIIAAIESALGLFNAYQTACASQRVIGLMFGAEDYALDIGLPAHREAEAAELIFARSWLVNACAAAHRFSFDGVWPDVRDMDGLKVDALQSRRLGFTGKSMIHPAQAAVVNEVFSPSPADIDYAARVIQAFDEAQARGDGAVAFGGQLLDLPIIERARRTVEMAKALGQ